MDGLSPLTLAAVLAASLVMSLVVLWALGQPWPFGRRAVAGARGAAGDAAAGQSASFLFDCDALVDQDVAQDGFAGLPLGDIRDWADLRDALAPRFGPLPGALTDLEDGERLELHAADAGDRAVLALSRRQGAGRVELTEPHAQAPARNMHPDALVARYQAVLDHAPYGMRMLDAGGGTIWQNDQFAAHSPDHAQRLIDAAMAADGPSRVRVKSDQPHNDRFFEVEHVGTPEAQAVFATDVTHVANAESMRREFIQTLTKIFANLTTGLAVFDRHRRLALFNPALLDLTGLPAPFLSTQPSLMQFFDSLRDTRVLPEPKNYATWRRQIEDMISTATDGLYLEDWHLPNGMTYRVTGRPHPDGAIAFLFEDNTDNVSLARHFRSQIALREAVLDASDNAKVVFGPGNVVTLCNRSCRDLLGIDPETTFADMALRDFLAVCEDVLPCDGLWKQVERTVIDRGALEAPIRQSDGTEILCRVQHLSGNSSIITMMPRRTASRDVEKAHA